MRWRIGLLQDSATLEKQAIRDAAKKEAERKKAQTPTVKTEAETIAEAEAEAKEKADEEKGKTPPKPRIKPLSETKAIESGANFISETFLFSVAAGLIIFESWRSNRKARNRRDQVAEQLSDLEEENKAARAALIELEREVLRLRAKEKGVSISELAKTHRLLPDQVYELAKEDNEAPDLPEPTQGLFSSLKRVFSREAAVSDQEAQEAQEVLATNLPGPAEKVLVEADRALEEKRRKREEEEAKRESSVFKKMSASVSSSPPASSSPSPSSTPSPSSSPSSS